MGREASAESSACPHAACAGIAGAAAVAGTQSSGFECGIEICRKEQSHMQKKSGTWVLLLALPVGMAWFLIAGVQHLLTTTGETVSEDADLAAYSGWETVDQAVSSDLPGYDLALQLRTQLSLAIGNEKIGDLFVAEDRLLQEPSALQEDAMAETAQSINAFYQQYTVPTCVVAVPSATEIYTEDLPRHATVPSQLDQITRFYDAIDGQIQKTDAYYALVTVKDDYIYYRTDSRWTAYGAYCVYRNMIQKMGYYPVSYDDFSIRYVKNDFRGDLYRACLYPDVVPDVLAVYTCEGSSEMQSMSGYDGTQWTDASFYHEELLGTEDAALFYMGTPQLLVEIQTNIENGKRLLVIKDSYGDCMMPFLTQHYAQMDVIDIQCLQCPLTDLVDPAAYQQVLILCDADTFQNTTQFSYLMQ
jgi:hypothetical protein